MVTSPILEHPDPTTSFRKTLRPQVSSELTYSVLVETVSSFRRWNDHVLQGPQVHSQGSLLSLTSVQ